MRSVIYSEYERRERDNGGRYLERVEKGPALFHCWGLDITGDFEQSGSYTVAIIELPNGRTKSVPVEMVRFTDKPETDQ